MASVAGMIGGGAGQFISNPVLTGFAAQEGEKILQKGQEEINKYISIGQLKYYFAVDTNYVARKLGKPCVPKMSYFLYAEIDSQKTSILFY